MRTGVSLKRIATGSLLLSVTECDTVHHSLPLRVRSWTPGLSCTSLPARPGEQAPRSVLPKPCALGSQQPNSNATLTSFLRKEVIQPHLPIRLPCYDFTPVISPAFGGSLLPVGSPTSGITYSHGVTGGVYKTRERIHRGILIRDY